MELLVLGGTAFLGRAIAGRARDREVTVTCLARGSAPAPSGVRFVAADRDDADGLAAVRLRRWDAVVDLSRQPGQVRRAVGELAADHWVFVSSANVYTHFERPNVESDPVHDPLPGEVMEDMSQYGPAKVAGEEAIRATAGTATIVRPGLIVGPGDGTGRGGYYGWRFAHPTGGDVLVPPDTDAPCALIDVEDLADWIVEAAIRRLDGTFNAAGPAVTLGEVLQTSRSVAGPGAPPPRPVPREIVRRAGITPWQGPRSFPLWIDDPAWAQVGILETTAARAAGLRTRPLAQTLARVLADERGRPGPRACGLTDADERWVRSLLDDPEPVANSGPGSPQPRAG